MQTIMLCNIKKAPAEFNGTLGDLYDGWAKYVMLEPTVVIEFHKKFCDYYLNSKDPLFLIRNVANRKRGQILRTNHDIQFRPTDNSPPWYIHYQLFSNRFCNDTSFATFVESIPCHMFSIRLPESINSAGWHVAHIFDVKNGETSFSQWNREELLRRTALNIHPCNYFYIPKCEWIHFGKNATIIAFFYDKFKSLYRAIWKEFLNLVQNMDMCVPKEACEYRYSFSTNQKDKENVVRTPENKKTGQSDQAKYSHSRLCFKADVIEPLGMDDIFCIQSSVGTFEMTKRQFYETFPNVTKSKSYSENNIYHYPSPPQKAMKFKCKDK
jgi:hypothetical protein